MVAGSPRLAASGKASPLITPASPRVASSEKASPKLVAGLPASEKTKGEAVPLKSATASREDNLTYDLKHLCAFDISPLPPKTDLLVYSRDSVQLLVNKIFALPRHGADEGQLVALPAEQVFKLPRTKPIPKVKVQTRWEKFMEERNMKKRKRSRLVFDEMADDWVPRFGYKSGKNAKEKADNWAVEVKGNEEDAFSRIGAEKKLLQARQKMREVRNKVEAVGGQMRAAAPNLVLAGGEGNKRGKDGLREAMKRAQASSASFGKFDRVAPNEATNLQPKRRQTYDTQSSGQEKERYLKAANRVFSPEGSVDKRKAAKLGRQDPVKVARASAKGPKKRSKQGGKNRR